MKRYGIISILLLVMVLMVATTCVGGDEETATKQTAEPMRTVISDGNIEASSHDRLTFGSGGEIDKIFVKEGDKVDKGDVLARLDTGDTDTLEMAEAQAQVALIQAQLALTGQVLALSQAEINVKNAEIALERAEDSWLDTESAGEKVRRSKKYLEDHLEEHPEDTEKTRDLQKFLREDWERFLEIAVDSVDHRQVTAKEMELELAKESVKHAQQAVKLAHQTVNLTQKSLVQARNNLGEEATILAPFDGMIAKVGAKEGEFLSPAAYTGTTIIEIIDLRHMELIARVDELDVVQVKTGQKVVISVDAMPEMKLEGRVTFISPVAREPGVVLFESDDEEKSYEVKIDFDIPENSPIRAGMSATAEIIVE